VANVVFTRFTACTTSGCAADPGTIVRSIQIAAGGSDYYNPLTDPNFPPSFSGSFVLSSDQPLAATVTTANSSTGSAYASDAYSGVSDPSASVFLPIIMGKLGVWNTRITVQNAGQAAASVTIQYIGSGAPANTTITGLPASMMAMVDQADNTGMTNFNGAALVTSDQPLAVVVDEYKTSGGVLVSYNGVPLAKADTTLYMPGFIAQSVWATDFTIVNTVGTAANVTVNFSGVSNALSGSIAGNGAAYVNGYVGTYPAGWTGTAPKSGYYGAATITSSQKVVVVYNISNSGGGPGNYAEGYTGFPSTAGATKVSVPLIENHYSSGWDTTFSVLSVDGTAATLSMVYSGNVAPICNPCSYTMTSADAGAHTFNQPADGHLPTKFIGGVTITSNKNIVVIADQNLTGGAGDTAAGFPGITAP
jgi:hypothetical protein